MTQIIEFLRAYSIWTVIIRLLFAMLLGGFIGLEREKNGQAAGLRTHILVCIGSCMTTLLGLFCVQELGINTDPLRIGAQVVSGIGFIGAGAILVKSGTYIRGLTTAASVWSTAAIGLAAGAGFYEGALLCAVIILTVISLFKNVDRSISAKHSAHFIYIEITDRKDCTAVLNEIADAGINLLDVDVTPPRSLSQGSVGVAARIEPSDTSTLQKIEAVPQVSFAMYTSRPE